MRKISFISAVVLLLATGCIHRPAVTNITKPEWISFSNGKARLDMHTSNDYIRVNDEISLFQQIVAIDGVFVESAITHHTMKLGEQDQLLPGLASLITQCRRGEKLRVWYFFPKGYKSSMGSVITFDLVME